MKLSQLKVFVILSIAVLFSASSAVMAQTMLAGAERLDDIGSRWRIDFAFSATVQPNQIQLIKLTATPGQKPVELLLPPVFVSNPASPGSFQVETRSPLDFTKYQYELTVELINVAAPVRAAVAERDPDKAKNRVVKGKAKEADDADVYIGGSLNGANKQKTSYNTEIKLENYFPIGSWRYAPFFRLNASTDPGADPDKMEFGLNVRRVLGSSSNHLSGYYYDNAIKIESERDFENTNLLYDTRLTVLAAAFPKGSATKTKFFPDFFVGGEFGKNLKSPLPAAQGAGIARILVGSSLRFVYFIDKENGENADWRTSYTRRWLLNDELGFKADDNGDLQIVRFGRSPRDFFTSKFTYNFNKFAGLFIKYEWGQEPPSYKFIDHRFSVGFAYKFSRIVK